MELVEGLKYLGAGLAVIGVIGAGIGIGNVFAAFKFNSLADGANFSCFLTRLLYLLDNAFLSPPCVAHS